MALGVLLGVVVVAGLVGGWANYLYQRADGTAAASVGTSLLSGIVAAGCVPLIMCITGKTDMLKALEAVPTTSPALADVLGFLAFIVLCVLAGVLGRRLVELVANSAIGRLEAEIKAANKRADEANNNAKSAQRASQRTEALVTEPDPEEVGAAPATDGANGPQALAAGADGGAAPDAGLDDVSKAILKEIANKSWLWRPTSGLVRNLVANHPGIGDTIDDVLKGLEESGHVIQRTKDDGRVVWALTPAGRGAVTG